MLFKCDATKSWWITCDDCGYDGVISRGFVSDECDGYYAVCQICGCEHVLYKGDLE